MNPDPGQDTETKKLKWFVFWFSRDDPTGHKRKNKKRETEEEGGGGAGQDNIKEWTGVDFASSTRAAENRKKWNGKGLLRGALSKVMGQKRIE